MPFTALPFLLLGFAAQHLTAGLLAVLNATAPLFAALVSHFVLSVQFDHTKPFAIGSIHTFHDSESIEPIPVGATVRIATRATDKYEKRGRRYVRHEVTVKDVPTGKLFFRETRDILSL